MALQSQSWFNPSKGEEVLWYSHPSLIMRLPVLLSGVFVAIVSAIAIIYVHFFTDVPFEVNYALLAVMVLGLGFSGFKMLVYKNTWYVITNRRIIKKSQIVGRETTSNPHREIVRVDINVSAFEAILSKLTGEDIGDMVVRTADDTGERFVIRNIPEISLAESYVERLSGTGPDTPAQYDAEERKRLQREEAQSVSEETEQSPYDSSSPDGFVTSEAEQQDDVNSSPHHTPAPVDEDDEFDEFEPSDSA